MMHLTHVSKYFGKLQVLRDVSITLMAGSCVALIGPNGSGKTTLIKSMLGMVLPDKGKITFLEKEIGQDGQYRNRIGYMPQLIRYPENMTIGQVIDMVKDIRQGTGKLDEELLDAFHLKSIFGKRMRTLSGGTRQKVGACLAFMFNPDLLILDEPTAGLDPVSAEILKSKILKEKERGKVTLISSHVLSELDEMVTDVVMMQDGRVLFQKSISSLMAETGETRLSKIIAKKAELGLYE